MDSNCRSKNAFAISVCRNGHATLQLGRSAIYLDVAELRSLIDASNSALAEYEKHTSPISTSPALKDFRSPVCH